MESFREKDKFLRGYVAQRSFEGPSSFPRMPFRSSDVDFNDVFGGPPRRFSLHESTRYSSDWAMDSEETGVFRLSSEKPVFGEESSVNRRKHQSNDFFDDIFQGVKSCSSPRRDFLNSLPASRITSPLRPLPGSELLDTSLPSHFSLPATLTRGMDYPTFASSSSTKKKEGTSNGISSLSRRSSQAIQEQDNSKNDVWPSNRPSPLSNEFSPGNEESSYLTKSNERDTRENSKEDSKIAEAPTDNNPFHFSIYKWGSGEVPLELPLREGISNGKIKTDTETRHISVNFESSKMGHKRLDKTSTRKRAEAIHGEDEVLIKAKPETRDTTQITIENFLDFTILSNKSEEAKPSSLSEISLSEETKKEVYMVTEETHKPDLKLSCSFLYDEIEGQGNEDSIMKVEGKENVGKTTKVSRSNVGASKNVKKNDGKRINSNRTEVNKANIQSSPKNPGGNLDRSGVREKVKDFVKIFNQETSLKSKGNEGKVAGGNVNEASVRITQMDTEMHFAGMNKMPDVSFLFPVDENVEEQEKHHSNMKFTTNTSTNNSCDQKDSSLFAESSIPDGFEVATDNINDPFQENYLKKELSDYQVKLPHTSEDHEATKALDAKILKWSTGKKGNIRSLLSTLQYIVWEESGWKPVPLVNIIEANAVKKVYQKALLCLHPDKLQQKGTASHEKYIAEKVFDILQEAWDHFNSVGSV